MSEEVEAGRDLDARVAAEVMGYYCADCAKAINEHSPGLCALMS